MIASLRGSVLEAVGTTLVVEVAGVGYAVAVTPDHALSVRHGEQVLLHTTMVVREDDISLFGFPDRERLEVFDLLRGVTGVGPSRRSACWARCRPPRSPRPWRTRTTRRSVGCPASGRRRPS